jgi:hypothetical protein
MNFEVRIGMNIIFLDIDGVLNSYFWEKEHQEEISDGTLIDLKKIELLSRLINEFSAKIVLHSGWKYWFDENLNPLRVEAERLQEMLKKYGLSIEAVTPDFADEEIKRTKKFSLIKAKEILSWVESHPNSNWVVIDDLDLHNEIVLEHQVMTNSNVGLLQTDIEKARLIFLRNIDNN